MTQCVHSFDKINDVILIFFLVFAMYLLKQKVIVFTFSRVDRIVIQATKEPLRGNLCLVGKE